MYIKMIDGTQVRGVDAGLLATRDNRELYLLGTSVSSMRAAKKLLTTYSFAELYAKATKAPASMPRTRYIKL